MNPNCADNLRKLADDIEKHVQDDRLFMRAYCYVPYTVENLIEEEFPHGLDIHEFEKEPANALSLSKHCGTAFCALGWAAVFNPIAAEKCDHYYELCEKLFFQNFTDQHEINPDWSDVFDDNLSSNKAECIQRLRDKADEIDARSES